MIPDKGFHRKWGDLLIAILLASPSLCGASTASYPNYALPDTQVRTIHSNRVGIDYKLYVGLPRKYAMESTSYSIVMLLDADSSFAMVRGIARFLEDHDELRPVILVGIAYPGVAEEKHGPIYKLNRTRDYTPTHLDKGGYGDEFQKASGGGDRFLDFINEELVPYLDHEFRVRPHDRTIIGHSYGGLLASYALLTRPDLFQRYIIISPSLWWDRHLLFRIQEQKRVLKSASERVFLSAGEKEGREFSDMAKDLIDFNNRLNSKRDPGLRTSLWIAPDETHHSIFPSAATRGIQWIFQDEISQEK